MIILKLFLNAICLFTALCFIFNGKKELKRDWYPKWIGVFEIITGVVFSVYSFTIWFI